MINPFKIKKFAAFILAAFLPAITFYIGVVYYSFMIALIMLLFTSGLVLFLGSILISNPFRSMLEGKGLLVFNIDSTGVIRPFNVYLNQPYVKGKLGKDEVNDVYDRAAVASLAEPGKKGGTGSWKDGKLNIELDENEFNKNRFGMYQYPVLIYNSQVKSLLTKDFLSDQEKSSFAEHGVLYLNRKMEELTSIIRDFGRYVVELTKPKDNIFQKAWFWIVIVVVIAIIIALFAKPLISTISGTASNAGTAIQGASGAVIPR